MKTIWKFPLEVVDAQIIVIPQGARILTVQVQAGTPCLWAIVEDEEPMVERVIEIYGTGHPIWQDMGVLRKYIGTFQQEPLVWHVFEPT